jgi:hypothetical protein
LDIRCNGGNLNGSKRSWAINGTNTLVETVDKVALEKSYAETARWKASGKAEQNRDTSATQTRARK